MSTDQTTDQTTDTTTPASDSTEQTTQQGQDSGQQSPEQTETTPTDTSDPDARIQALEADLAAAKTDLLRARVQARYGISDADADLFLTATDEDTLNRQAEALAARSKPGSRGPVVASQGNHPTGTVHQSTSDPIRAQLADRGMFGH